MENLEVRYDSRKSFYGKAKILVESNTIKLFSYGTMVAEIEDKKLKVYDISSQTTTRHVKEFARQNGFWVNTKKDLEEYLV